MKKKIFLMLAIMAMLVCVFAISVSAKTVYKTADGTTLFSYVDENGDYDFDSYEGSFPKTDAENNALTWYITATTTEGDDTVHTVACLKTLGEAGEINSSGAYSFISPVTNKNTVSVNFPDNAGIKSWAFKNFGGHKTRSTNNILFVYCPNTLTTLDRPFQETQVIVVELDSETPITNIPQNFAHEARNLTAINIPASVTIINGNGTNDGTPFYNNYSLESVTFNSNTNLTEIKMNAFLNCTSLQVCHIPDSVLKIGNSAFNNTAITNNPFTSNSQCTSIGQYAFRNCSQMTAFTLPKGITELESSGYNFSGCAAMTTFDWNGNNSITTIPQRCFENCSSLTSMNMPKSVEVLSNNCFASCSSLIEISIPNSVKTIKNHAFAWCTSLEVIRMGASFEYFNNTGDNSFTYTTGKVKEIYIPNSFYKTAPDTSLGYQVSYAFHGASADCKFFYCGTAQEFETAKANFLTQKSATSNNGAFINATVITYDEYVSNPDKYASGRYVVCGYNTCEAFYDGEHTESGTPTYKYSGEEYLSNYVAISACSVCGITDSETVVCGPLFINKGYAKEENGSLFTYGIVVDKDEIAKYVAHTGKAFNYGMIVAAGDLVNDGALFDESAKAIDGTIIIDVTTTKYTVYQLKMTGIKDTQKDLSVYACAYVIDGTAVSYIGEETTDSAVAISYNQIKALITNNTTGNGEATENTDAE